MKRSSQLLKDELILVLYFMLFRKLEISLMHLQSNPYAFCLADNKFCGTE